jgi:hypothetical protein
LSGWIVWNWIGEGGVGGVVVREGVGGTCLSVLYYLVLVSILGKCFLLLTFLLHVLLY